MIDVKELLEEIKNEPYEEIIIKAPHCSIVTFAIKELSAKVVGPSGNWNEKPGTILVHQERERNKKTINALQSGEIVHFFDIPDGSFVEAGTPLLTIRHFLTREEVIAKILRQALYLFNALEKGKYYFIPTIGLKINTAGCRSVNVTDGQELFILSRMKRERTISYSGPAGVIYSVYFKDNDNIDSGLPLIGVCPENYADQIQDVINLVQNEWDNI